MIYIKLTFTPNTADLRSRKKKNVNFVLSKADCTGEQAPRKALDIPLRTLALTDLWKNDKDRPTYTRHIQLHITDGPFIHVM